MGYRPGLTQVSDFWVSPVHSVNFTDVECIDLDICRAHFISSSLRACRGSLGKYGTHSSPAPKCLPIVLSLQVPPYLF
jgi:hypothetical protein